MNTQNIPGIFIEMLILRTRNYIWSYSEMFMVALDLLLPRSIFQNQNYFSNATKTKLKASPNVINSVFFWLKSTPQVRSW